MSMGYKSNSFGQHYECFYIYAPFISPLQEVLNVFEEVGEINPNGAFFYLNTSIVA